MPQDAPSTLPEDPVVYNPSPPPSHGHGEERVEEAKGEDRQKRGVHWTDEKHQDDKNNKDDGDGFGYIETKLLTGTESEKPLSSALSALFPVKSRPT